MIPRWIRTFSAAAFFITHAAQAVTTPEALVTALDNYPHAVQKDLEESDVIDHEIGLGAIQKFSGAWQFEKSERVSGHLSRYTWQITDGFSSNEVMNEFIGKLLQIEGSKKLFSCDGRSCGHAAQWANKVFNQRILYGRQDLQRYRVFSISGDPEYRLVVYSGSRTSDRHYLHIDLLRLSAGDDDGTAEALDAVASAE
ncbi:MAG: DUF4892 domain-containing protein [Halioglobus sp.]|nr:DUF4892 domain-containing protein [Halioglobus sp.]